MRWDFSGDSVYFVSINSLSFWFNWIMWLSENAIGNAKNFYLFPCSCSCSSSNSFVCFCVAVSFFFVIYETLFNVQLFCFKSLTKPAFGFLWFIFFSFFSFTKLLLSISFALRNNMSLKSMWAIPKYGFKDGSNTRITATRETENHNRFEANEFSTQCNTRIVLCKFMFHSMCFQLFRSVQKNTKMTNFSSLLFFSLGFFCSFSSYYQ